MGGSRVRCAQVFVFGLSVSSVLAAPPTFTVRPVGLIDAEHRSNESLYECREVRPLRSGSVVGHSLRNAVFGGGRTPFMTDASGTTRMGFFDQDHISGTGFRISSIVAVNAESVLGTSTRYLGTASRGQSAWVHSDGVTRLVGLVDADHTRTDGTKFTLPVALTESGIAAGYSVRYSASMLVGQTPWLDHGGVLTVLGYTDADHTGAGGVRSGTVSLPNALDQFPGSSVRYPAGSDAWVYDHGTYIPVTGLTDAAHTGPGGVRFHFARRLNSHGVVAGFTSQYAAGQIVGQTAWVHADGVTIPIGLTDAQHTREDGGHGMDIHTVTEGGLVVGTSAHYANPSYYGTSVWVWDGTETRRIGLFGPGTVLPGGHQNSRILAVTDSGIIVGWSEAIASNGAMSFETWIHRDGVTTWLRLDEPEYHVNRLSGFSDVNEAGDVLGYDYRSYGPFSRQQGWLFNHASGETTSFPVDLDRDGVEGVANAGFMSDGSVAGLYRRDGAVFPYLWSSEGGLVLIENLIEGGLGSSPVTSLSAINGVGPTDAGDVIVAAGRLRAEPGVLASVALIPTGRTLCRPDVNGDGFIDFFDYLDFVDAFESGGDGADFNRDGFIDFADYSEFVAGFEAGC